jgi:hypothetical protein
MARSRAIRVTPNVHKCLEELKSAIKSIPAGEARRRARAALDYLSRTFAGQRQPRRGRICPPSTDIRHS